MNRNEQVIQALKDLKIDQSQVDETRFEMALSIAISTLERQLKLQELGFTDDVIDNYKQFEDECIVNGFTFNSLIEAREKQIAKKPMLMQLAEPEYMCECGMKYWRKGGVKYCIECGQKFDWN